LQKDADEMRLFEGEGFNWAILVADAHGQDADATSGCPCQVPSLIGQFWWRTLMGKMPMPRFGQDVHVTRE